MSALNATELPNPFTPLAFLPPTLASQLEASRYLYVATLAAFIWDMVMAMPDEYKMLASGRFGVPIVAYVVSRIASVAYVGTSTAFQVSSVVSCEGLQIALGCCFAVATPATSLLFFFRVRAVFLNNKLVTSSFAFMWIAVLAGSITVPFAISGAHIGTTDRCINTVVKPYSSAGLVINGCSDTLVFLAISWRLVTSSLANDPISARVHQFYSGDGLPRLSKKVLQSGQLYYLVTVGLNIATMALILTPSVPPVLRAMFTVPNLALENAMATRVFRAVRLGAIRNPTPTSTGLGYSSAPRARSNDAQQAPPSEYPLSPRIKPQASNHRVNITITQQTEVDREERSFTKPGTLDDDQFGGESLV